ncbi:MAG: class I SAM-dependent methyltransferase [Mariprofundaceae bacterium]
MAHHKAISKTQWMTSQKAELTCLGKNLQAMIQDAKTHYSTILEPYANALGEDAQILEIGCGPACTAQLIEAGHKTYIDPLLDDIRRAYPSELPDGDHITGMAESIARPDKSFDLILCLHALSFVQNPELVLHEIKRLLKDDGTIIISITVWPKMFAQLHYLALQIFPLGNNQNRLYRYTYQGIYNTLARHFEIESEQAMSIEGSYFLKRQTWLFVCKRKEIKQ